MTNGHKFDILCSTMHKINFSCIDERRKRKMTGDADSSRPNPNAAPVNTFFVKECESL